MFLNIPPHRTQINESFAKATETISLALDDLREANKRATPVESLLLLDAIRDAAALLHRVKAIHAAAFAD